MSSKYKSGRDVRFPAEWEPQSFLQLTFPHKNSDWEYLLDEVSVCFIDIINTASKFENVLVICNDVKRIQSYFPDSENIHFAEVPSNDTWARDHGGITVLKNNKAVIHDYIFNGWGNKFEATLDNLITKHLYSQSIFQNCKLKSFDFVLEGGSIESDGNGTILTTSECLLSKNRNGQFSKQEIEAILKQNLGAKQILWLNNGYLAGDDTDSHIDTLARFCDENTIVYVGCDDPENEHFHAMNKMKAELQHFVNIEGKPYQLVELPLPDPCFDNEGNHLPATYANFVIINKAVLVPVYNVPQDIKAVEIIKSCFPEREIVSVNCRILIEQHGSLHCVTMQYPEPVKLNIEMLDGNG